MEIFARLLFGHLLADFTFQTNYIANWKRHSILGLLAHVAIHPVCYILLTWPYLGEVWTRYGAFELNGWMVILVATVLHYMEDWFRVAQITRGWNDNTVFYVWDQFIHIFILWVLLRTAPFPLQQQWPLIGCLFVIVTHFATVTIWFIEKDIYGRPYPETEEKYISIMQRLVVWLAFFLPHPWWIFISIFVIFMFGRHVWTRRIDFSITSVLLGNAIAIVAGLLSRFCLKSHF